MRPKSRVVSGMVLSTLGCLVLHVPTIGLAQAVPQPAPAETIPPTESTAGSPPAPAASPAPAAGTAWTAQPVSAQPTAPPSAEPVPAATTVEPSADPNAAGPETTVATTDTDTEVDVNVSVSTESAPEPEPEAPPEAQPGRAFRQFNTLNTSTGGMNVQEARIGTPGAFRLQFGFEYFSKKNALYKGDQVEQQSQKLSWSWSATKALELFASLTNHGTSTTLPVRPDGGMLAALGDVNIGGKVGVEVSPGIYLGSALRLTVLPTVGSETDTLETTSGGLTGMMSVDLRQLDDPLPIIGRLNVDYFLDNSYALIDSIEDRKYDQLEDPAPRDDELGHLINRFERLALGISRVDTLTIGVGFEAPLDLGNNMSLHPLAEWTLGIPVNRQGYDCPFRSENRRRGRISSEEDSCLDDLGLSGMPQHLTAGLRFVPPIEGLSTFLAVDVGLTGSRRFSQELAPTPVYKVIFGAGYDFEPRSSSAPTSDQTDDGLAAPHGSGTTDGRLMGVVVDRDSGAPVVGAEVRFVDSGLTALATGDDGRFISYALPAGAVLMDLRHPNYDAAQCTGTIPKQGGEVEVRCTMESSPQLGSLQGQLRDPYGTSVGYATLKLSGPTFQTLNANQQGFFHQAQLPTGIYDVQVEAPGYLTRAAVLHIHPRIQTDAEITLTPLPKDTNVQLQGSAIRVANLDFVDNGDQVVAGDEPIVAELAAVLLRYPMLKPVRIQAPGQESLSLSRSQMLKQRLVNLGVEEARLEATGGSPAQLTISVVQAEP